MNKCCQLIARGNVQDIGFRGRIENFGRGFDLRGQVQNENNGSVKILCGGENGVVDDFAQVIRNVTVKGDNTIEQMMLPSEMYDYLPYPFGKVHTDTEEDIGRKLDIGNDYLRSIKNNTSVLIDGQSSLIEGQSSLIEGQKSMCVILKKMDKTLEKIAER